MAGKGNAAAMGGGIAVLIRGTPPDPRVPSALAGKPASRLARLAPGRPKGSRAGRPGPAVTPPRTGHGHPAPVGPPATGQQLPGSPGEVRGRRLWRCVRELWSSLAPL